MQRRQFLVNTATLTAAAAVARPATAAKPAAPWEPPLEIAGDARQRGIAYGTALAAPIREFYEREVVATFSDKPQHPPSPARVRGRLWKENRGGVPHGVGRDRRHRRDVRPVAG